MDHATPRFRHMALASLLVVVGVAMLVLPGPGIVTIALGVGLMGRELRWAWVLKVERRLRNAVRRAARRLPARRT